MKSNPVIPIVSVLTLLTSAAGCTDPAIGDWQIDRVEDPEYGNLELPFEYTYDYGGMSVTISIDMKMSIDEDGGELIIDNRVEVNGTTRSEENSTIQLETEKVARGVWDIRTGEGANMEIDARCEAEKDTMVCTDNVGAEPAEIFLSRITE